MQPQLALDTHEPSAASAADRNDWSGAHATPVDPSPAGEAAPVATPAAADLPAGADPDLMLHAIQKREQRTFALKLTTLLCGFFLAAYLAGSGNGAILQGVIHVCVGAVAGGGLALLWQRRRADAAR